MPRTPLFALLQRTFRIARASAHAPWPADEALGRWQQSRRLSRREFLAGSAALGAAAALPGCAVLPWAKPSGPQPPGPRVVIVGAGIAGLSAGYRLRQAGIEARIFEAQSRVGGRMFSLRDHFADGQVIELGGELIDTNHTHIRALAAELGIPLDDLADEDPGLEHDVWFFEGRRYAAAAVVEAFRPIAARIAADLATITGDEVTYREPNGAETLDRMSLAAWLDGAGVSGWMRALLDVGYTTEYGREIDEQSALNLLFLIDPEPDPFRIFGESDERFRVRDGNDRITTALAGRLQGAIETGAALESVSEASDGSFRCSFRRGRSSREVVADHLVIAIPFTLLRQVRLDVELPAVKRRAIAEIGYGTNAKLMVGFSERVWRATHRSNGSVLTDLPFQLCWETSRKQPGAAGILTNFTGGRHGMSLGEGTTAEQAARFATDLDKVFPGVATSRGGGKEVRFHWPTHPWTLGSYACYLPGQWTGFGGSERERVGRIHFAGEHASIEAQGFMEGGCETGEAAAAEILEDLDRSRKAA